MQPRESLHKLVYALFAHDAAHEEKGERARGRLRAKARRVKPLNVHTLHVAMPEHAHGLAGDAAMLEVVHHALALWYDVGGAGAGYAVGHHQQPTLQASGRGPHQSGEGMHAHRHPGQPRRYHAQQSGLGRHGVDHPRAFLGHDDDEPHERHQVGHGRYAAVHGHRHAVEPVVMAQAVEFRTRRRHGHHVVAHRPHLHHHVAAEDQRLRHRDGP